MNALLDREVKGGPRFAAYALRGATDAAQWSVVAELERALAARVRSEQ